MRQYAAISIVIPRGLYCFYYIFVITGYSGICRKIFFKAEVY